MKSILISIKPEEVKKILNGEMVIETRNTAPKCELPCKVYIYCTKGKPYLYRVNDDNKFELTNKLRFQDSSCFVKDYNAQNGKVVAEFMLKNIVNFDIESLIFMGKEKEFMQKSCLGGLSLRKYLGDKIGYSWGIEDLKIYDNPKELSEFRKDLDCDDYPCNKGGKNSDCEYCYYDYSEGCQACRIDFDGEHCIYKIIKRPPANYIFVESLEG